MIHWYWAIAIGIGGINIGFVVGAYWGARPRDDYDPAEYDELLRVMPRIWDGLDRKHKEHSS